MFEFKLPDLGEGIHEGELLQWHVAVGDEIKEDDPLCDVETDKAAVTIPSPRSGVIVSLNAQTGDTMNVGDIFVVIDDGRGEKLEPLASRDEKPEPSPGKAEPDKALKATRVTAAPATRRMAREMGIDIRKIQGTGPGGRVTPEDLNAFDRAGLRDGETEAGLSDRGPVEKDNESRLGETPAQGIPFFKVSSLPEFDGPVERIPIRSLRKKVAIKTTSSSILIPHVAHMDEVDVTDIDRSRKEFNDRHGEKGKLTLLAFVIKAVAAKLKDYPMFNASVDPVSQEILHKKFYNIGFAADTPRGLMVPVIHDADRQSLAGIGYRIRYLAEQAREGTIGVPELTGGTFSITNVGAIGGTHVFPIINGPESAILGLGRVEKKPVVKGDEILIRKRLPITLCFDHRVADGAQAAAFAVDIKNMLEDSLEFMSQI